MSKVHQTFKTARKNFPGVISLRDLDQCRDAGFILSTGVGRLDELLEGGGLPAGRISEFYGAASAGKTSLVSKIMAGVTSRGGCVAYVDFFNTLAPEFLEKAGVDLENVLWVRGIGVDIHPPGISLDGRDSKISPSQVDQAIINLRRAVRQVEILMQSRNFTLVVMDVADSSPLHSPAAAALPGGTWFRLQRAAEKSKSVLLLLSGRRISSGASARVLSLNLSQVLWRGGPIPLRENDFPAGVFRNREKRSLLVGIEGRISVMKGGRNGRSTIFHCRL